MWFFTTRQRRIIAMLAIERKNEILNKLRLEQRVLVSELALHYGVTEETIRRDLDKLEKEGFATKTYGGAIWGNSIKTDLSYTIRNKTNVEEKTAIAKCISSMIQDGENASFGGDDHGKTNVSSRRSRRAGGILRRAKDELRVGGIAAYLEFRFDV